MREKRDRDLAALLAAAAAPDPERDADERGLEVVLAAYREAAEAPAPAGRTGKIVPIGHRYFGRALAVKFAAAAAVLAGAGMAAASVGVLPAPIQRIAHDYFGGVGIPGPTSPTSGATATRSTGATPSASRSRAADPTASAESSTSATASASPAATTQHELVALCQIVVEAGPSWHSDVDKAQRDLLTAAAGGNDKVLSYCTALVAGGGSSAPAGGGSSPTSGSGNGNGNGGGGNGNGNGNGGGKGHASASPSADSSQN